MLQGLNALFTKLKKKEKKVLRHNKTKEDQMQRTFPHTVKDKDIIHIHAYTQRNRDITNSSVVHTLTHKDNLPITHNYIQTPSAPLKEKENK